MNRKIFCKLGRWCCVLVKQVVRVTLTRPSWHRSDMVQWLVSCATELGYEALISLMKSWYTLFTAAEATSQSQFLVSFCIVSSYAVTVSDLMHAPRFHSLCDLFYSLYFCVF